MNAINGFKVFQMNDYDWVAGPTLEECIKWYLTEYIQVEDDQDNREDYIFDPLELSEESIDKYIYRTDDEPPVTRTFREELIFEMGIYDGGSTPYLFASTEY